MKPPSNYANHLRHAKGEPREFILSETKDGVVGARVFGETLLIRLLVLVEPEQVAIRIRKIGPITRAKRSFGNGHLSS